MDGAAGGACAANQTLLRDLYQMWTVVWDQVRVTEPTPGRVIHAIRAVVWRSGWYGVLAARPQLGVATAAQPHAEALAGVLKVVRVGNLAVLHGTLPLLGLAPVTPAVVTALVDVVRDHLHTLRSAIPELDPAAAATDEAPQPHTLAQLVAKWRSPPAGVGHTVSDVRVVVAAHRRERVVEAPIVIRGQSVTISTSIGVVLSGAARWSPDEIVRVADEAMYQAKQAGKGCYQVVDHRPTPA